MAIEYEMPLGMLVRRMYCAGCGTRLVRKQVRKTYQRGEEGFRNTLSTGSALNVLSYTAVTYVYRCSNCHRETSYEEQVKVAKKQARTGRKFCRRKRDPEKRERRDPAHAATPPAPDKIKNCRK